MRSIYKVNLAIMAVGLLGVVVPGRAAPVTTVYSSSAGQSITTEFGINDAGHVAGWVSSSSGFMGFLRIGGVDTAIGVAGAVNTVAVGLNNSDTVVGMYNYGGMERHGYVYNHGTSTYTKVDVAGATATELAGINNANVVVGNYRDNDAGWVRSHAFIEDLGTSTVTEIVIPGAIQAWGLGLNDNNEVVGSYQDSMGLIHGFIYNLGTHAITTVDIPGARETWLYGINNSGDYVGWSVTGVGNPVVGFVNIGGTFASLPGPSGSSYYLYGINNMDQISGGQIGGNGNNYGIVIGGVSQYVPEPGAGLLMASGGALLVALGLLRRRKA